MAYFAKIRRQRDGRYLVEFPELPGCLTEGQTQPEAEKNAQEALNGYLSSLCDRNLDIEEPKAYKGRNYRLIHVEIRLAFAIGLRQLRKKHGYTQSDVARKIGVSQQAYAKLEMPDANPSLETVKRISAAFGSRIWFGMTG